MPSPASFARHVLNSFRNRSLPKETEAFITDLSTAFVQELAAGTMAFAAPAKRRTILLKDTQAALRVFLQDHFGTTDDFARFDQHGMECVRRFTESYNTKDGEANPHIDCARRAGLNITVNFFRNRALVLRGRRKTAKIHIYATAALELLLTDLLSHVHEQPEGERRTHAKTCEIVGSLRGVEGWDNFLANVVVRGARSTATPIFKAPKSTNAEAEATGEASATKSKTTTTKAKTTTTKVKTTTIKAKTTTTKAKPAAAGRARKRTRVA